MNNKFDVSNKKSTHLNIAFKLINHLDEKRKFQLILLIFIMLLSALAEVLIVVSIIPFLLVISDPEKLYDIKFISLLFKFFGIESVENFIIPITISFTLSAFLLGL